MEFLLLTLDGRSVATARHRDIDWAGWRDRSRRNAEEAFTAWTNDPRQGGPPMAPRPDDGESRADFVARTGVPITHAILHDGILEESDDYVSIEGTGWAARWEAFVDALDGDELLTVVDAHE